MLWLLFELGYLENSMNTFLTNGTNIAIDHLNEIADLVHLLPFATLSFKG